MLFSTSRIAIPEGATSAAMDVMGTYTKVPRLMQGGSPVYQRAGSSVQYLFFWPAFRRWLIGPDYKTGFSSVQSRGGFAFGVEEVARTFPVAPCTMDQLTELNDRFPDFLTLPSVNGESENGTSTSPDGQPVTCEVCVEKCRSPTCVLDCAGMGTASYAPFCPDEASDWSLFDGIDGWVSTFPITVRAGTPCLLPSTRSLI